MAKRTYTSLPYTEYTVAEGHYDTTRKTLKYIVLHSSASTKQGLINTFAGGTRQVSAHYGIDLDGNIMAFLEEYNTSFANGNYSANQESITIEHVDNAKPTRSDKQYETSAELVADICKFYGWEINTSTVKIHSEIVATACPNGLDRDRILKRAREINNSTTPMENPDIYGTLVKKSTQFDKVCAYLEIPSDPKDVMFEDVQKVVAGIKGSANTAQRQAAEIATKLAVTEQEVKNREEQVSRLKTQLLETVKTYEIEIEALKNKPDESDLLITSLRGQIDDLQTKFDETMKQHGGTLKELAETKKNLDICNKSGPTSKSLLDFILDLLKKTRVIS